MKKVFYISFLSIALITTGCFVNLVTVDPDIKLGLSIDKEKALELSSNLVKDIIAERHPEIYATIDKNIIKDVSVDDIPKTLEQLHSYFGKPLEAEYKSDEVGYWQYPDGQKVPMRKFWYSVKTAKAEKGTYFLYISIVPNENELSWIRFAMVSFPDGLPDNLK